MDPDPQLLSESFCFYVRQHYQSTQTHSGPFSSSRTRSDPGSDFRIAYAACRHNRFLHRGWASWIFRMCSTKSSPSFLHFPPKSCQAWSSAVSNFTIIASGLVAKGQSHQCQWLSHHPFFSLTTQQSRPEQWIAGY